MQYTQEIFNKCAFMTKTQKLRFYFFIAYGIFILFLLFLASPFLIINHQKLHRKIAKIYMVFMFFGMRNIIGLHVKIEGLEHIQSRHKPFILASKHSSMLETFILSNLCQNPAFILKQELHNIPIFGWFLQRNRMIAINRAMRTQALKFVHNSAQNMVAQNREIVIFPEGTRKALDATPDYKSSIFLLRNLAPVYPVAHNCGVFWHQKNKYIKGGLVVVRILPQLNCNLSKDEFMQELTSEIEGHSNQLCWQSIDNYS